MPPWSGERSDTRFIEASNLNNMQGFFISPAQVCLDKKKDKCRWGFQKTWTQPGVGLDMLPKVNLISRHFLCSDSFIRAPTGICCPGGITAGPSILLRRLFNLGNGQSRSHILCRFLKTFIYVGMVHQRTVWSEASAQAANDLGSSQRQRCQGHLRRWEVKRNTAYYIQDWLYFWCNI